MAKINMLRRGAVLAAVFFTLFLLLHTVSASVNMSIGIDTVGDVQVDNDINAIGDVSINTNVNATGNVRFNLNGIDLHTIYERNRKNIIFYIREGIEWLNGETHVEPESKAIGYALGRHFVSVGSFAHFIDNVRVVITNIINKLQVLSLRLEAIEQTLDEIAPDAYCRNKVKTMLKYS